MPGKSITIKQGCFCALGKSWIALRTMNLTFYQSCKNRSKLDVILRQKALYWLFGMYSCCSWFDSMEEPLSLKENEYLRAAVVTRAKINMTDAKGGRI